MNPYLIVEGDEKEANEFFMMDSIKAGVYRIICRGDELTEDIAYEMVDGFDLGYFVDYNHPNPRAYKLTALESFISAIEATGYHWGENPVKYPDKNNPKYYDAPFNGDGFYQEIYSSDIVDWKNSESRTFNPSKCIIFEIL